MKNTSKTESFDEREDRNSSAFPNGQKSQLLRSLKITEPLELLLERRQLEQLVLLEQHLLVQLVRLRLQHLEQHRQVLLVPLVLWLPGQQVQALARRNLQSQGSDLPVKQIPSTSS